MENITHKSISETKKLLLLEANKKLEATRISNHQKKEKPQTHNKMSNFKNEYSNMVLETKEAIQKKIQLKNKIKTNEEPMKKIQEIERKRLRKKSMKQEKQLTIDN